MEEFQLRLITERGTPTHRWKAGESTIDLAFTSEYLANHVIHCKIDRKLDCDSDHLPISLVFDWSWQPANPTRKRLWTKTNVEILRRTVEAHLPEQAAPWSLETRTVSINSSPPSSARWMPASTHQPPGRTRRHARSQDLIRSAKTSALKSNSSAGDSNDQDRTGTTRPTGRRETEKADSCKRCSVTPIDSELKKHPHRKRVRGTW
jgi:hypothetical protein